MVCSDGINTGGPGGGMTVSAENIMAMVGGLGKAKPATAEVQDLCDQVKAQVEAKEGRTFSTFTAIEYKTQVVSGTNYFIKIHLGVEEYLHLRLHKALPHEQQKLTVSVYQLGKTKEQEILYF